MTLWTKSSRLALACTGVASLALSASATCNHPKCSLDVDQATTSTVPVIVQYATDPADSEVTAIGRIGPVYNRMHMIRAVAAQVPASQLFSLASRPGVSHVSLDRTIAARQTTVTPIGSSPEFTAEPINAPWAWAKKFDGQGIGIAIIDSGITPSADLSVTAASTGAPPAPPADVAAAVAGLASLPVVGHTVNALTGPLTSLPLLGALLSPVSAVVSLVPGEASASAVHPAAASVYTGKTRIVYSYNFTSSDSTDTSDGYGHGTHVAGLIAGNGTSSTGAAYTRTFVGMAPNANLINLRALDANGQGSDSTVIAAIEAAILLKNTYNIKVINLSLGRPIYESYTQDPLCQAVEQAWKAGIVVVAAAGNDGRDLALNSEGYGTIEAPGNDPYIITVGAANTMNTPALGDDVMATYSSKGPSFIDQISKPDIIAPGNLVTSLLAPNSSLQPENPRFYTPQSWYIRQGSSAASTDYFPLSGTSMAAAVASGAIADLAEVAGYLTPDQIKVLLMTSANKNVIPQTDTIHDPDTGINYIAHNDVFTQGAGYLDLQATIQNTWSYAWALPTSGYAMSPVATYNATTGSVTLVTDSTALWGRSLPGGANVTLDAGSVYGQNAFVASGATALWGRSALGSGSDPEGFTALWGSTALWGRATPDAQTALWGRSTDWTSSSGGGAATSSGATALWGRNTTAGSGATTGSATTTGSTALWGRSVPDTN